MSIKEVAGPHDIEMGPVSSAGQVKAPPQPVADRDTMTMGAPVKSKIATKVAKFAHEVSCVFQYLYYKISRQTHSVFTDPALLQGKLILMTKKEKQAQAKDLYTEALEDIRYAFYQAKANPDQFAFNPAGAAETIALLINYGVPNDGLFRDQQTFLQGLLQWEITWEVRAFEFIRLGQLPDVFFQHLFDRVRSFGKGEINSEIFAADGCSGIYNCIKRGFSQFALSLLKRGETLREGEMEFALQYAVKNGSQELVESLLPLVGKELSDASWNPSLVDCAWSSQQPAMLNYLLTHGAVCPPGALIRAYTELNTDYINILMAHAPKEVIEFRDGSGRQAIWHALTLGDIGRAKLLMKKMEAFPRDHIEALVQAYRKSGDEELIDLAIAKMDVDGFDRDGRQALWYAIQAKDESLALKFFEKAKVTLISDAKTQVHLSVYAWAFGMDRLEQALAKKDQGQTGYQRACQIKYSGVILSREAEAVVDAAIGRYQEMNGLDTTLYLFE